MIISMQGNWTVAVKEKFASFPQRFIITGAISGNGVYTGDPSTPAVYVTGALWSIAIQNDPGSGFQLSDTRIKFPTMAGTNYSFDIESNDAGGDGDFNDLVLTCTTPAATDDFIIYGNVSLYSGLCRFNPCRPRYLVIDTYSQLLKALENDRLRAILTKYYPERIPHIKLPNPPDPPPYFTPMVINVLGEEQIPEKAANLFRQTTNLKENSRARAAVTETALADTSFVKRVTYSKSPAGSAAITSQERAALSKIIDGIRPTCHIEAAQHFTLSFAEYDRTPSELAGGSYTGNGPHTNLGSAITDINGNYIFRFKQTLSELVNEILHDVAPGENYLVQALPDVIVKITDSLHPSDTVFESAPYFNIQHLKQIDICLPKEKVPPTSLCFNGNLIGSLGNVFIGGAQNSNASFAQLERLGYNNHLRPDGKITVHNNQAGFGVDCAAWAGLVDVKGCMYNLKRSNSDPLIERYTIRYSSDGVNWQFVQQDYSHPRFSKRFLPNYSGDPVGPFFHTVNVPNVGGAGSSAQNVPTYINIQKQVYFDGIDWEFSNLDRYMQLNTGLYDGSNNTPGTVYFLVEGYDAADNVVSGARDLIALYIHNRAMDYGINSVQFTAPIENLPCGLYKMTDAEMNTPLNIQFIAKDDWGFVNAYGLSIGKCPSPIEVDITAPSILAGTVTNGVLKDGTNASNIDDMTINDTAGCPGYTGTSDDFGTSGLVTVTLQPAATMGGWLRATEQFGVISVGLSASIRKTNGYNSGVDNPSPVSASFYIERK
ncbi:hypothetical protein [Niabella soli]|uniref:Uncharacterized protein n=1 Tax=Niabella soli DSM 19437 TaxID=929713 RepID=W0F3V9_9BACT|nr:hypothetical protein [Niabella soli]AHF17730.1 hypothetical protein NIASO_13255 [Niabella soli DSM 19437]